ncbi:alpha/beta hydrolase [Patescibacteria group bacterium]|nr:alpha/beta hydrolase [Patescibacteria group bacterium]MBU1728037.1 alpha/beta hydrolase [Patescibacteria group bacterium]
MKKVFIVHGFGGIPNGGWIPWLMEELATRGVFACALPMPDSRKPVVSKWIEEIRHAVNNCPEDEVFLVGHSLGVSAVLRYLENVPEGKKIAGALLISGLISPLEPESKKSIYRPIDSFVVPPIDLEKVKNKALKFVVLHSIDDPAVPFFHAEKISSALGCKLIKTEKGGHFFILSKPICYKLPEALEILEEIFK